MNRSPVTVEQDPALPAHGLGQEKAEAVHAGRMELVELHVLQRQATPVGDGHPVAGQGVGVGGDLVDHPVPASREQNGRREERGQLAGGQLDGQHSAHPAGRPVGHEQVEDLVLVEEGDLAADALLVEGLQDGVPGPVGGIAGATNRCLAVVPRVAAEAPLVDEPLRSAVEGQAQVLEVADGLHRIPAHDLRRVLVDEIVPALDRVPPVPLPVVLLGVAQRGAHPTLGCPGVGSGGVQLGNDPDPPALAEAAPQLEGGVQPGSPRPNHHRVEEVDPWRGARPAPDHGDAHGVGLKKMTTMSPSRSQRTATMPSPAMSRARMPPRGTRSVITTRAPFTPCTRARTRSSPS